MCWTHAKKIWPLPNGFPLKGSYFFLGAIKNCLGVSNFFFVKIVHKSLIYIRQRFESDRIKIEAARKQKPPKKTSHPVYKSYDRSVISTFGVTGLGAEHIEKAVDLYVCIRRYTCLLAEIVCIFTIVTQSLLFFLCYQDAGLFCLY